MLPQLPLDQLEAGTEYATATRLCRLLYSLTPREVVDRPKVVSEKLSLYLYYILVDWERMAQDGSEVLHLCSHAFARIIIVGSGCGGVFECTSDLANPRLSTHFPYFALILNYRIAPRMVEELGVCW